MYLLQLSTVKCGLLSSQFRSSWNFFSCRRFGRSRFGRGSFNFLNWAYLNGSFGSCRWFSFCSPLNRSCFSYCRCSFNGRFSSNEFRRSRSSIVRMVVVGVVIVEVVDIGSAVEFQHPAFAGQSQTCNLGLKCVPLGQSFTTG